MKNNLPFSCHFIFNIKVGRDIQVSSLHIELKKKNSHHQHVEVNKPSCITPGGRGLQFVFIYTYAQENSVFQQKKRICQKVISYLLLWHFKTPTALPKDTNTFDIIPYVPFFFLWLKFFLICFCFFIYLFFLLSSAGKVSQNFTDLKCAS